MVTPAFGSPEQERNQHIYRRQGINLEHQGWKNDNNGQPSWHRPELQNNFKQSARNTFRNTWLDLGFNLGGVRKEEDLLHMVGLPDQATRCTAMKFSRHPVT